MHLQVGPAVVRLDSERSSALPRSAPILRGLFEDRSERGARRERGQGSGFVYDGRLGLIVTNAHVVKGW